MDNTQHSITQSKQLDNPFQGMEMTLKMLTQLSKKTSEVSKTDVDKYLTLAWRECKDSLEKRQLFFSIVISFGDVTNREHNIFTKKGIKDVAGGGHSLRKLFLYCLDWMNTVTPDQFYNLFPLLGEYHNLGANTIFSKIWTDRFTGETKEVLHIPIDITKMTDYIAAVLKNPKTSENELKLWARWLWTVPRMTRRRNIPVTNENLKYKINRYPNAKPGESLRVTTQKLEETKRKNAFELACIKSLSKKMDWEIKKYDNNINFVGYNNFRSKYQSDTEAVMFSTKRIELLDKKQFIEWVDKLPHDARYNVQKRVLNKDNSHNLVPGNKWFLKDGTNMGEVFLEWMRYKKEAQEKLRKLSEADKEQLAKQNPEELKHMVKAAKVNVGSETLFNSLVSFLSGASTEDEFNMKAQALLDKIGIDIPVLVFADISGSMAGRAIQQGDIVFTCQKLCALMVTIFLLKNPDSNLGDMFIRFDQVMEVVTTNTQISGRANRFGELNKVNVDVLTDRTKDFVWNLNSVSRFIDARFLTHFNIVADELRQWMEQDGGTFSSIRKELINQYQVFLVVSDGDMNNQVNENTGVNIANATMRNFMTKMRDYFGWEGVIVVWDIKQESDKSSNFEGIENVLHLSGFNPSIVDQVLKQIGNVEKIDIYSTLKSISMSNRYAPIREVVR